jgi:hypothetical protein
MSSVPRHWQVLILAALGIGATLVAVPRALSGIVAVPQGGSDPGISRTAGVMQSAKISTATVPGWSPSQSATPPTADKKPPSPVTNLSVRDTGTTARISWSSSSDNVAVRGYLVRADGSTSETSALFVSFPWASHTASFMVKVAAVDTSGNQSAWGSIWVNPPNSATTKQPEVITPPVEVNTTPTTPAPTDSTTPPPPPPSSAAPVDTTPPSQVSLPVDTSAPTAQQSPPPV